MQSAPPAPTPELDLLRSWREPLAPRRLLRDGLGSLLVHVVLVFLVLQLPEDTFYKEAPVIVTNLKQATHLVAPPMSQLTQRAPNKGKVLNKLDLQSAVQAQPAQAPHPRRFVPGPPAPLPASQPLETAEITAPQIQTGPLAQPPSAPGGTLPGLSAPTTLGAPPKPVVPPPAKVPQAPRPPDPLRRAMVPTGRGPIVGDFPEDSPRVPGITPSPCTACSALQLLSDPNNVDFKPYLLQVLAQVKSHWMSVIPDSARHGRRGIVVLKFDIDRKGIVQQLEFTTPTGTELDRAAVAGISASVPFPPLPAEYRGTQIRLQMAFSYNMTASQ